MTTPMSTTTSQPSTPRPDDEGTTADERGGFLSKFTVLLNAPRELWLALIIKFLMFAAYGLTNSTIKLWLSSDFGCSDKEAIHLVLAWSLTMTVVTLLVGSLTDAIGLRKTFFLGVWICAVARLVMAFATVKWLALAGGLFPLAIGEALGAPVVVAAIRRYSNTKQRSISFSFLYMMMNLGLMVAGFLFDGMRSGLGEHGGMNALGRGLSTYQSLFLVSFVLELGILPFIYFLRKGAEVTDEGLRFVPELKKYPHATLWQSFWLTTRDSARDTVRLFLDLMQQTGFYRLLGFLGLIGFLKLIFMQMYYVFPTFGIRELGEGAPVGRLWSVNPFLILFLAPVIGALTQRFSAYSMIVVGGIISAVSVFIMALPTAWFEGMADSPPVHLIAHSYLGLTGAVNPYYAMIVLFVVLLSIGEAFYSPRVYEYAAAIAPKGQEASYSALSYIPFLLAKVLIGTFSGILLEKYCPPDIPVFMPILMPFVPGTASPTQFIAVGMPVPRDSGTMWLVVALTASICPIGLLIFRRYIRLQEAGR
jgi:MFS family permease